MHFATMANWIQLSLFIYFGFWSAVEGAQLTIDYATATQTLTISCRPGSIVSEVDVFSAITVERDVSKSRISTKPVVVAVASPLKYNGEARIQDTQLSSRATVTGKADNNNKPISFVQVVLRQVTCSDSGQYFCRIKYFKTGFVPGESEDGKNKTIPNDPGPISMFVTPRKEASPYYINETVEFQCNGNVGNPPENRPWSWQWKYADSMMDWTSYPYNNRITDDPVTPGNCVNQGRSTLRHVVSVDDNARMFRCLVNKNEMYSANFTIYTESKTVTTPRPGGVAGGDTSSADIGLIVGIVLGVLAVIAIVVVLVYFLWYRRRNAGKQYKTEEDKHPESDARPDHMTPNPVYDTRPEPKDFRKKKGEVNPSMDDRHNSSRESIPSYDNRPQHNDRGYNYGYAEDGGAMPIGSAV